jgi:ethanolamine ammonia-lyase small subunit
MIDALVGEFGDRYRIAPLVIATQARVALGDHIGQALGVETVLVLIGERPGLSVADSLGIYLTHRPAPGRTDADRNCVSNIHPPDGLDYPTAAAVAAALVAGARKLGRSGIALKDSSRSGLAVDG